MGIGHKLLAIFFILCSAILFAMAFMTYPLFILTGPDSPWGFTVCLIWSVVFAGIAWTFWKVETWDRT